MKAKILTKIYQFFTCIVLYNFILLCYLVYIASSNIMMQLTMIAAIVLWFYSFLIELMQLLDLIKEDE